MKDNNRYAYIDNLKLCMIILVVLIHLAVTYSGIGSWSIMDVTGELDVPSTVFFALFQTFTQGYFMGFMFLLSGYFVVRSYEKKGCKQFLTGRLVRLGIPVLLYMLVVSPFIQYVLLGSMWERPSFGYYYLNYITSLKFLGESGPLWFALALLLFNMGYCLIRIFTKNREVKEQVTLPGDGALFGIVGLIFIITFLIRLVWPIGTNVLNMQLCFFTQYIILFIFGVKAGRYDWFSAITLKRGRKWLLIAFIPGILIWAFCMITGGALDGDMDIYMGGMSWQSAVYALWESLIAAVISLPVCFLAAHFIFKKIPLLNKVL